MTVSPFAEFILNLAKILRITMALIRGIVGRVAKVHLWKGTFFSFQFINEEFAARSRKSRDCAEAYCISTSPKKSRRLTQRSRQRSVYGWQLVSGRLNNLIPLELIVQGGATDP